MLLLLSFLPLSPTILVSVQTLNPKPEGGAESGRGLEPTIPKCISGNLPCVSCSSVFLLAAQEPDGGAGAWRGAASARPGRAAGRGQR